jgi:hypothetical protein
VNDDGAVMGAVTTQDVVIAYRDGGCAEAGK